MSDKVYSQAEADALIAGAVLAAAALVKRHNHMLMVAFNEVKNEPPLEEQILALTTERTRLAQEERELEVEKLNYHIKALFEEIQRMKTEASAREAKLIADTRLEEAEWWANGHHSAKRQLAGCPQCDRLAAHRAAVQPGG